MDGGEDAMHGDFTMPGEAGYENLTVRLAKRWGADGIRDCEGTQLSDELMRSGKVVYSTLCIIREHTSFAKEHPFYQQQIFLESERLLATDPSLRIPLLALYFSKQFSINEESVAYWQVFDRTTGELVVPSSWKYESETKSVVVENTRQWHQYSVNFLAYRIWEEINLYNHVTNHWDTEPLRQLDPRYPEVQEYLVAWLRRWCEAHLQTDVVRFTSLFYNFVWIWGSDERNPFVFTDWASYDSTVSPLALEQFAQEYGYTLWGEDFINQGYRNPNHIVWNQKMVDYLWFTNRFVCSFAKVLVDTVHEYGKKAFVFYDDSWVGMEPQSPAFQSIGFDGIIKCVFSGFEARLCSAVPGNLVHELRLHPYLFPVGLGGGPTFKEGGNPALDARRYWVQIRRALLRSPVDRIGLGGYLHLTQDFPEFVDTIADIADQFRKIKQLHRNGSVYTAPITIGILTSWGKLRSWTCGGHYHEHPDLDLVNILESLAGLPYTVVFLDFDEVKPQNLANLDVLINAGFAASSWSGGAHWKDDTVVELLTRWVHEGGVFLGVNEPSVVDGYADTMRMAPVLGVDVDDGRRLCHGLWRVEEVPSVQFRAFHINKKDGVHLLDGEAKVLQAQDGFPVVTEHTVGKGKGLYLSGYRYSAQNTSALRALIEHATGKKALFATDNPWVDSAYFPALKTLVLVNGSAETQHVIVQTDGRSVERKVEGYEYMNLVLNY
ncbi:1,3-beta-galactosyl-N-acetylhexosamine phosphorylase [Sphaerochaeta sp.]|uniref:1,3-beta-galactosyl-N-acetylhexosamine phosphorylase n=1 Tax=Sphaerochaeta sp. TaxID=1972642 RepID=UPI002FC75FEF